MPTSVLICDDSALARKMLARALPDTWSINLSFASSGEEALTLVKQGQIDLLLLDLNMPGLNGYQVLEQIQNQDLPVLSIVISGDVQPDARTRAKQKGALDFIRKPIEAQQLEQVLREFGLLQELQSTAQSPTQNIDAIQVNAEETLQEVFNIAMGQAGASLSSLLKTFIELPVPRVKQCLLSDLPNQLKTESVKSLSAITQGFSGYGISGEVILLLGDDSVPLLQKLNFVPSDSLDPSLDLVVDLAGILTGACLQGVSEQLDAEFSCASPVLLGRHCSLQHLLKSNQEQQVLMVELDYRLLNGQVECDLIVLFTEESIPALYKRLEYLQ
ncbi:response regulator [Aliidiomarina minuta]|uniref:Response regulator n=1 Tax=Aliidiomarina minuta TaxID=880057 RepID=A0A432W6K7_9GAMM|nr:response regulator [Aliidiomarina minuta]RUO25708.1 response regulator [Aliidiomarina minuta]